MRIIVLNIFSYLLYITAVIGHRSRPRTVDPSPVSVDYLRGQTVLCINFQSCQVCCDCSWRKRLCLVRRLIDIPPKSCFRLSVTNIVPSNFIRGIVWKRGTEAKLYGSCVNAMRSINCR